MSHKSTTLGVLEHGAKFVSRSLAEMFELVAGSMDECLTTAKRTAHPRIRVKTAVGARPTFSGVGRTHVRLPS